MKRITPYQGLLNAARKYVFQVKNPHSHEMWTYSKEDVKNTWSLKTLYERTKAADQLGFDVVLKAINGNLVVRYCKRPDAIEWFIG